MKKLLFLLIMLCGYLSLDAMNTRSKNKTTKKATVPSRRKKRKISPTAFTVSEEEEKNTTSETNDNDKEKKENESDSEQEDGIKVNLPLAQFLHQLSETDGEESMNAIAMMKDKHLDRFMTIKEKELELKTMLAQAALQRMKKDTKHGMTIALGDLVIKTNTHNDPPEGFYQ